MHSQKCSEPDCKYLFIFSDEQVGEASQCKKCGATVVLGEKLLIELSEGASANQSQDGEAANSDGGAQGVSPDQEGDVVGSDEKDYARDLKEWEHKQNAHGRKMVEIRGEDESISDRFDLFGTLYLMPFIIVFMCIATRFVQLDGRSVSVLIFAATAPITVSLAWYESYFNTVPTPYYGCIPPLFLFLRWQYYGGRLCYLMTLISWTVLVIGAVLAACILSR